MTSLQSFRNIAIDNDVYDHNGGSVAYFKKLQEPLTY